MHARSARDPGGPTDDSPPRPVTRRRLRYGALVATVLILLGGGATLYVIHHASSAAPSPVATADLTGSGPGTLISAMTMPSLSRKLPPGIQAARVVYRSTEGDTGAPTQVSGTVFAPTGDARTGGWPVLALGHGTVGINEPCAPSLSDTLSGLVPIVVAAVQSGAVVAVPDYQGLGAPGIHPYLDARTAGFNVIDAVRAARLTFRHVSQRWVATGWSQGGAAVWAADEYAASYAPELQLAGVLAVAPAADVTGLVDRAQSGTLTQAQAQPYGWLLTTLNRLHPEFNLDDYRHGVLAQYWDALSGCAAPPEDVVTAVEEGMQPNDLAPVDDAAADRLRGLLARWALPQRPLDAPLLVVYGSDDPYIDAAWTDQAISRACALNGTVSWRREQGKGHDDLVLDDQLQWLTDRVVGKPLANQCPV